MLSLRFSNTMGNQDSNMLMKDPKEGTGNIENRKASLRILSAIWLSSDGWSEKVLYRALEQ
jgi:hypothetical protein